MQHTSIYMQRHSSSSLSFIQVHRTTVELGDARVLNYVNRLNSQAPDRSQSQGTRSRCFHPSHTTKMLTQERTLTLTLRRTYRQQLESPTVATPPAHAH